MKLNDVLKERIIEERRTDTPRTDNFVSTMPALHLDPADFADHAALVRTVTHIREHMINWVEFSRELERELIQSVPREWKQ